MKRLIQSAAIALALCMSALPAGAQALTGYQLRIYLNGGGPAPVTTYDIPLNAVTCGQPRVNVTGPVTNPNTALFEDDANRTLDCRWVDNGTGPLFALPFSLTSTYTSRIHYVNAAGIGPESPSSNLFTRPGSSPATFPANVRMHRP